MLLQKSQKSVNKMQAFSHCVNILKILHTFLDTCLMMHQGKLGYNDYYDSEPKCFLHLPTPKEFRGLREILHLHITVVAVVETKMNQQLGLVMSEQTAVPSLMMNKLQECSSGVFLLYTWPSSQSCFLRKKH